MSTTNEGLAAKVNAAPAASTLAAGRARIGVNLSTWIVWVAGTAIVAGAQPSLDRRLAAAGAALAGIAAILLVRWLTPDPARRYLRSLLAGILAVAVTADWGVRQGVHHLPGLKINPNNAATTFFVAGQAKRITLPLVVVLLAPLVLRSLFGEQRLHASWQRLAVLRRQARVMDWIVLAYCALAVLALLVGLAHHNSLTYVAQDLGLVAFFVFMYIAGRAADAPAAGPFAGELVNILLLVAVGTALLLPWGLITGLFAYIEATAAGALAFLLLRPRGARLLPLGVAAAFLVADAVAIHDRTSTSTGTLGLIGALGILAYLALRARRLVRQWLLVALAVVAVIGFFGFTNDGRALRGQYHGSDPSNLGRTYEAHQVRTEVRGSPVSLVLGRGFGGTIDETRAPFYFREALVQAGRDVAHVQEIHLLAYSFLLKTGFLGLAWLAALVAGLAVLAVRALERASRTRDPALVVYAALAALGIAAAFGGASNLQANPLNALALGILVTCLARPPAAPAP
jgi:hypothetical protein